MFPTSAILVLLFVLILQANGEPDEIDCTNDEDCPSGYHCVVHNEIMTDPTPAWCELRSELKGAPGDCDEPPVDCKKKK
ncbi:hypothetical protein DdX_20497 [Ditylenchus destructor]|uniref:Uncharacterized protein n=1 Tax=Ditylenchus destructor TaxID=166010 RepID=A0AAD4MGA0_9BILA|nr:hypothetical protein DdX_20497 [Ditylenchus destructor]